jgi:hypothetical protein|tara:strand:+ start:721 stop:894 length:174 start_codon:yes stop_codon:yes gene_type:complete
MSIFWRGNNMNSSNKKRNLKPKNLKGSEIPGKNCTPKAKSMSAIAKLMATFYGIDQN